MTLGRELGKAYELTFGTESTEKWIEMSASKRYFRYWESKKDAGDEIPSEKERKEGYKYFLADFKTHIFEYQNKLNKEKREQAKLKKNELRHKKGE